MKSQSTTTLDGEYYLNGVMETASGFKLDKDSTFRFFFSYGALDRFGNGRWSVNGDRIVLNSTRKHPADFALVQSKKQGGDGITVRFVDANPLMLKHIYCMIEDRNNKQEALADSDGIIHFKHQQVDSIILAFEFCPEKQSRLEIPVKDHNYFELRFEPWIMEVLFENFNLQVDENGLLGGHPLLLEGRQYTYEKASYYNK